MKTIKHGMLLVIYAGLGLGAGGAQAQQDSRTTDTQLRIGTVYLSEDMFWSGRYTGMNEQGPYLDLGLLIDSSSPYDAEKPDYWHVEGRNLGLDSRRIRVDFGERGKYSAFLYYQGLPNNLQRDVGSPYRISGNTLVLPDAGGRNTVGDNLARHDLGTLRERIGAGARVNLDPRWRISTSVHNERKDGTKLRGFVDGFWVSARSVLAPTPVDYETTRLNADLTYDADRLQTRLGYHISQFRQSNGNYIEYDHLFNNDWSTAERRRESIEPDNNFHQVTGSVAYRLGKTTRLGADVALGRMTQDDTFVDGPVNGQTSLDGEIRTTMVNLRASMRPVPKLNLRTSYRYDDRDNRTAQFDDLLYDLPGMGPSPVGRSTRPVSYTQNLFNVEADYRVYTRTNISLGFSNDERKRTYDDREETDETALKAGIRSRLLPNATVGGEISAARQRGSQWERLTGPVELRKFYLADRDRIGAALFVTTNPMERLQLTYRGEVIEDDYLRSELGLLDSSRGMMSLDASYIPIDSVTTYAFYAFERREATQAGLEASTNTAWLGERDDQSLTLGLGVEYQPHLRRYRVGSEVIFMDSVARNVVTRDANDPAYPIVRARLNQLSLYGSYELKKNMLLGLRYMYEKYREDDWGTDGYGIEGPGNLILPVYDSMRYEAHLLGLTLRYRF